MRTAQELWQCATGRTVVFCTHKTDFTDDGRKNGFGQLQGDHTRARVHKWLGFYPKWPQALATRTCPRLTLIKFYLPQGHIDDADFQRKVAQQWARILENTEHFVVKARESEPHPNTHYKCDAHRQADSVRTSEYGKDNRFVGWISSHVWAKRRRLQNTCSASAPRERSRTQQYFGGRA